MQHTARTSLDEEHSYHNEMQQRGAFLEIDYFNGIKNGFIISSACCDGNGWKLTICSMSSIFS